MRTKLLLLAVVAMFARPALAEEFYVGGGVGQSSAKDTGCNNSPGITFTSCTSTDTGLKVFGGVQINPNFGVEVAYIDLGKIKATALIGSTPVNLEASSTGYQIAGVLTAPISDRFALFGKLGVFLGHVEESGSGGGASVSLTGNSTTATYGVGGRLKVTDRVALRVEYEQFKNVGDSNTTGTSDISLVSVSALYRF